MIFKLTATSHFRRTAQSVKKGEIIFDWHMEGDYRSHELEIMRLLLDVFRSHEVRIMRLLLDPIKAVLKT